MTALEEIQQAIDELDGWVSGSRTFWNELHGSVTGDYENQVVNTANADNAQKFALAAKLNALVYLATQPHATVEPCPKYTLSNPCTLPKWHRGECEPRPDKNGNLG